MPPKSPAIIAIFPKEIPCGNCTKLERADLAVLTTEYPTPVLNRIVRNSAPFSTEGESGSMFLSVQKLIYLLIYGLYLSLVLGAQEARRRSMTSSDKLLFMYNSLIQDIPSASSSLTVDDSLVGSSLAGAGSG